MEDIGQILKKYDDVVYCVDTVSSAGGMKIAVDKSNWIDICINLSSKRLLGLPPGMSTLYISHEKARERAEKCT
ncbi:MAG: aminotransferase class V-fold PLP-dependent enzyme [Thomasclavelia sp.]